ncbi:TM0106 family RecB-like putative nuclease [Leptolyngbya sp. FACHB-711]|uniref:TM0106 family RecB-like putative nuclease n=1 Tax=unclassified Leptolyngbya TaxID=2650499 RepID=UPI001F55A46F|nr:TM0106 family RecB-like putative nuclease [Leptolyngbya sp. FACHB-711]
MTANPHQPEFVGAESLPASLSLVSSQQPIISTKRNSEETASRPILIPAVVPDVSASGIILPELLESETLAELQTIYLTDDLLFTFQRCRRRSFLDVYGDRSLQDPPSNYLLKLKQDSQTHQQEILLEQPAIQPDYFANNWAAGATATLELMQQGVDRIAQGVLLVVIENGITLVSSPNLLVKQPGQSIFGDWIYAPVDIRLGKRPKLDYQVVAAFHAYLLAAVQGAWSETSWLILRRRGAYAVNLTELLPRMEETLQGCIETLLHPEEPEIFISSNRCDLCHWYSHCYGIAQSQIHLSLLPGVTPSRYIYLKEHQITTLEALAAIQPKKLESLPGFGPQVAHRLIRQAQAALTNEALPDCLPQEPVPYPLLSEAELPTAPIELYFDIEAAPEQNIVYLHGVLVVDRLNQTETFHALLAENQTDESLAWQKFLDLVWQYPDAPIYHFCPYEVQTAKRLAQTYGTPTHLIAPLIHRFVDLHERITRVAILPVESYALKPIARWVGFDWRDPEANGAQSVCWYDQWVATGDRTYLDLILRYNEDDCRATYVVKDWLVQFCQTQRD